MTKEGRRASVGGGGKTVSLGGVEEIGSTHEGAEGGPDTSPPRANKGPPPVGGRKAGRRGSVVAPRSDNASKISLAQGKKASKANLARGKKASKANLAKGKKASRLNIGGGQKKNVLSMAKAKVDPKNLQKLGG